MPIFEYNAIDNENNRKVKSTVEAVDLKSAEEILYKKNLVVTKIKSAEKGFSLNKYVNSLNKVTAKDLVIFSRQFSVMLKANVPVVQSLKILIKQTKNPKLKDILQEVAKEVDGGIKLSQALEKHKKVFSNFFVAMIESGETSGRLDEVLEYLANQQEKDYDLMAKIKGAMIYPIFILSGLLVVGTIMMVVVVPKLTDILKETGGELPLSTRILIGTSSFMSNYWWLLLIIIVGIIIFVRYFSTTTNGKVYKDWALIKMPIFGQLFRKIYLVRLSRSLSTLSSGGIPLVEALRITSQIVGNQVYQNILDKTIAEIKDGKTIGSVFIKEKEIPSMVSYMVSVGETTGKLDVVLEKLADFYSREVDNLITNLVSLIEPLIMVILGVAVGLMVAAIIMPMYNLASSM